MDDTPMELQSLRVGEGELPSALDRINWGAFLIPGAWVLVYGSWGWLLMIWSASVAMAAGTLWATFVRLPAHYLFPLLLLASVLSEGLIVAFAYRANKSYWEREQRRVARESDDSVPRLAVTVDKYVKSQKIWKLVGLALLGLSTLNTIMTVVTGLLPWYWVTFALAGVGVPVVLFVIERRKQGVGTRS